LKREVPKRETAAIADGPFIANCGQGIKAALDGRTYYVVTKQAGRGGMMPIPKRWQRLRYKEESGNQGVSVRDFIMAA
jgi:hypothetical protein